MPKECTFCDGTADFTGEHLWSDWVNGILPFRKGVRCSIKNDKREVVRAWTTAKLDWKTKAVCRTCNNTWMSNLENKYAKPAMLKLILDRRGARVGPERAHSIALFAFKTAVIFDHLARNRPQLFFDRSTRHEFRSSLTIPRNVMVWITRYAPSGRGEVNTVYHEGSVAPERSVQLYVCTYAIHALVIQIVSYNLTKVRGFEPRDRFLPIPVWPTLVPERGIVWPPDTSLGSRSQFDAFSDRWQKGTATY